MVSIKVEYDVYNRRFRLVDRNLGRFLEDGAHYLLIAYGDASGLESQDDISLTEASERCEICC